MVFTPTDLGIPIDRSRKYIICVLKQCAFMTRAFSKDEFSRWAFRQLNLKGEVFFQSRERERSEIKAEMAATRLLPATLNGKPWRWRALLTPGDNQRLEDAISAGLLDGDGCGLISLSQNVSHQRRNSHIVPA